MTSHPAGRAWLLDVLKASGCVLIVLHHLAFYGPMSDVVAQVFPGLMEWLFDRARLAVQMFLVCGGYLTATSLGKFKTLDVQNGLTLLWRRYLRLVMPLLVALSAVVLVSEIIRPDFNHASLSALPHAWQALAHVGLLQHVLGMEALSAGVWYVAIDFQLYGLALVILALSFKLQAVWPSVTSRVWQKRIWMSLAAASLWWWSGQDSLEDYAVFFCGAYGLGYLACQMRAEGLNAKNWAILCVLGGVALIIDPRWRLVTCWAVAVVLAAAPSAWFKPPSGLGSRSIQWLSRISYSVFVIHFSVSLAVNAWVTQRWPEHMGLNALGMLLSLILSLLAGAVVFRYAEQAPPNFKRWLAWVAVFMASVALAIRINSMAGG
jgi:peptidoglycan/LPS O-acetylase OafA/YrhL